MDAGRRRFLEATAGFRIVALDTNACIYYLRGEAPLADLLAPLMERAAAGSLNIALSALVQLELLVRPYRMGDPMLIRRVLQFTERHAGIVTYPITRDVVLVTAQIRAMLRLKAPDALIAGSASVCGAEVVIGNDGDFERLNQADGIQLLTGTRSHALPAFLRLDAFL
ncbi:MAG: type II toxin-antitoxin system VapC family toxin [Dehalococcoidia bacterium]